MSGTDIEDNSTARLTYAWLQNELLPLTTTLLGLFGQRKPNRVYIYVYINRGNKWLALCLLKYFGRARGVATSHTRQAGLRHEPQGGCQLLYVRQLVQGADVCISLQQNHYSSVAVAGCELLSCVVYPLLSSVLSICSLSYATKARISLSIRKCVCVGGRAAIWQQRTQLHHFLLLLSFFLFL